MDREKLREILVQLGGYQGRSIGVDGVIDAILKLHKITMVSIDEPKPTLFKDDPRTSIKLGG